MRVMAWIWVIILFAVSALDFYLAATVDSEFDAAFFIFAAMLALAVGALWSTEVFDG